MRYFLKKRSLFFIILIIVQNTIIQAQSFTLQSIKSYPFPTELTAAAKGTKIAWAFNEEGKRNIYVAEGPEYIPRKLTNYTTEMDKS